MCIIYRFTRASSSSSSKIHKCTHFCMSACLKADSLLGSMNQTVSVWTVGSASGVKQTLPLTLIYCPANCPAFFCSCCLQTVMCWSVGDAPLCCASSSLLSLVRSSIFVSLSLSLRRFCSVALRSDWSGVMGLTLSSPESGDALSSFCFLVIQLFPSILRSASVSPCGDASGFYLNTVSELRVFIHIWCSALWWKWICVYWERGTEKECGSASKPVYRQRLYGLQAVLEDCWFFDASICLIFETASQAK